MKAQLSTKHIKEATALEGSKFVFVVGKKKYKCGRFQALMLSGRVRRMLEVDNTVDRLKLSIRDRKKVFHDIVRYMNGGAVEITQDNWSFLAAFARELECDELLACLDPSQFESNELFASNVVGRMRAKKEYGTPYDRELKFAAEHFTELDSAVVDDLSVSEMEEIISHPNLKLVMEDDLWNLLLERAKKDESFVTLLRYVKFLYLSKEVMLEFLDRVFPDLVDPSIWKSIMDTLALLNPLSKKSRMERLDRFLTMPIVLKETQGPMNGFITYLTDLCNGNVHTKGIVVVESSSFFTGTGADLLTRMPPHGRNLGLITADYEDSWIQFDFRRPCAQVTAYTLVFPALWRGVSWVMEVSNDLERWYEIDSEHYESSDYSKPKDMHTFICCRQRKDFFRYVRIRQTEPNAQGSERLALRGIEFFGTLMPCV